ncbi:MAG: MBL fold metallo-hydrolase [Saprospiraceae bacterium]
MIDIDFEFHPIGQGLFYSGIFNHRNGNQFSMVYDCGSDSTPSKYLENQVDEFVNRLVDDDDKKLDVLFVSHFHRDHINRISYLLNKTNGAKNVILPYLKENEMFLALFDFITGDDFVDSQGNFNEDIFNLISSPVSFFRERKVDKIIFIHPDNDDDKDENFGNNEGKPDNPDSPNFQFNFEINLKPNQKETSKDSDVIHFYSKGILSVNRFWEFKLFNKPRASETVDAFKEVIKILIKSKDLSPSKISLFIKSNKKTFKKDFQTIYFKHFGKGELINQTSLIVYHGATNNDLWKNPYFYHPFPSRYTGTFLCADITLDVTCINDLKRKWIHYNKYFDNVVLFQVPHHGSENDMDLQVFQEFTNTEVWLINFGLGNTHDHPRQKIVNMLADSAGVHKIVLNTQIKPFYYHFRYYR